MGTHRYGVAALTVMALFAVQATAGESIQVAEADGAVEVKIGDELFTRYNYTGVERPYFYPVIGPTGDNVTRHWPMDDSHKDEERDHPHHKSLWYTHGDMNGQDFWHDKGNKIVQTKMKVESGKKQGSIITENEWRTKNGKVVCSDERKHYISLSGDSRIIDFEITIKASHGQLVIGDTKEGSMALRVAPTLRNRGKVAQGKMVNSEGGSGKGIWGKRARWADYYGPLNGKTVGIAWMDHPDNPRHPTTWMARDYGFFGINPFGLSYFEKKPKGAGKMKLKEGESVTFKYRLLLHKGTPEEEGITKRYEEYTK